MYLFLLLVTIATNISADFLDRHTSSGRSDPFSLTLWSGIVQSLLVVPLIGLVGRITGTQLALTALVAAIASAGRMQWYRALGDAREQLSRLAPFLRVSSVFVLLLAVFLLRERMTAMQVFGATCVILSALLVTLERPASSLSAFLHNNRGSARVLQFAFSTACISVLYRYLLHHGVGIWTCYFYMRLFQLVPLLMVGVHTGRIRTAHIHIPNLRLFFCGRFMQTAAAFMYLAVLQHLPLTTVEPFAAGMAPFLVLGMERLLHRRQGRAQPDAAPAPAVSRMRWAALCVVACGMVLMEV